MGLVIEDGTGIVGANAYVDIAFVDGYLLGERLAAWQALSEPEQEAAIIEASTFVDITFNWIGKRKTLDQGLYWPRTGVAFDGFPVVGVPLPVKKATVEAVSLILDGEELYETDADVEVSSEQVDVIKVSYRDTKNGELKAASRFDVLNKLLRGLYKSETGSGPAAGGMSHAKVVRT